MRRLLRPLWIVLALLFLMEAWLWDHLEPIVARVVNLIPWGKLKEKLARLIEDLPPWATLIVFVVPFIVLLPLKFLEVYFLAKRNWLGVVGIAIFAKLVGVGVTAFVFDVTRDKLMEMHWFERLYDLVMKLRAKAAELVDPIKQRIRELIAGNGEGWSSRTLRMIQRFRKSVHEAR